MIKQRFVFLTVLAWFSTYGMAATVELYSQDFDVDNPAEFTSTPLIDPGFVALSHFTRTNQPVGAFYLYFNTSGSFFSGLTSLSGGSSSMTTRVIDITNMTNLQFAVDLAAENILTGLYSLMTLDIEYQIDGGSWSSMMNILPGPTGPSIFGTNEVADGSVITNIFSTFSSGIAGTGSTLSIRSTWNDNGGNLGDFIGLDNINVTGDNTVVVVPVPAAAIAGLGMLGGLGVYRRVRR